MERNLESQFRDMYWAGFTTMAAIIGIVLFLIVGGIADKAHNDRVANQNNITEVI